MIKTPREITIAGIRAICEKRGVNYSDLMSRCRTVPMVKVRGEVAEYLATERKMSEDRIGSVLGRTASAVSGILMQHRKYHGSGSRDRLQTTAHGMAQVL